MFGRSFLKDFDDDPFFSGHSSHKDMFDSFGAFRDPFMAIDDGRGNDGKRERDRGNTDRQVVDPFGSMFQSMNGMWSNMHKHMADMHGRMDSDHRNVHSFSSSSVMSYQNDGKSEPKIYQATKSTRRAPGQIKETRRGLRDSESGIEKMSIGHHIGDRGKVVERRRNLKAGGGLEEEKNFLHVGEDEEHNFDREWRDKTSRFDVGPSRRMAGIGGGRHEYKGNNSKFEQKRRALRTPVAVPVSGRASVTPSRPHGPSKSGRERSKY